jgi:predicted MFS family arabinose efflux permease
MFHTKILLALRDPSTWLGLAATVTAAAAMDAPFSYLVMFLSVPGIILKGGAGDPPSAA